MGWLRRATPAYPSEARSPYDRARREWDERIGSSTLQARNWRLMAFGALLTAAALGAALVEQVRSQGLHTFVVEVDPHGEVAKVQRADQTYLPRDGEIAGILARWIECVRRKSTDPVAIRSDWLEAYKYLRGPAVGELDVYARAADPFKDVGRDARPAEVRSVVRRSDSVFDVRWHETRWSSGRIADQGDYTASLSIAIISPQTEADVLANPLGVFITNVAWSRDL